MRNDKRLPDAELEVMQTIWSLGTQVTAAEVQQHADKDWKMTSVLTFLSRLCDKGFLSCTKEGRQNLSDAGALTEQDIDELRVFLDRQTH